MPLFHSPFKEKQLIAVEYGPTKELLKGIVLAIAPDSEQVYVALQNGVHTFMPYSAIRMVMLSERTTYSEYHHHHH